ncbi:transcriptional regulator [Actinocatenispora thailandica]|uniref:Transcriptional regulator n=1 Tax=Actinocatenispora thailandica TaxID=227318 RepID=A0A7R7HVG3_9ACTN|nr:PadR family transcriptional regulator [Actinocatenispora thailandica]BCJ34132.1 transcriptional regulator [Actinocatenispora thailandica]
MSLRYALLGLLADEPGSGYELARRFEATLDRYAWHAKHNQIYQELGRLADERLVEVVAQGARGRKTYAITDPGRRALVEWLRTPPESAVVRNEFLLRLFLTFVLDPAEAREHLRQYAEQAQQRLDHLTAFIGSLPNEDRLPPMKFGHLAATFGLRQLPAIRDWALDSVAEIDEWQQAGEHRSADPTDGPVG